MTTDVSFAEELLWRAEDASRNPVPFFDCSPTLTTAFRIRHDMNRGALEASVNEIVRRHSVLRSTFVERNGRPERVCAAPTSITVQDVDLQGGCSGNGLELVNQLLAANVQRPFDLALDPVLRTYLVALPDGEYLFVVTVHHIAFDQWSRRVLATELRQLYEAYSTGQRPALRPIGVGYTDYISWQRSGLDGARGEELVRYWVTRLRGAADLALPYGRSEKAASTTSGTCRFTVPTATTQRLGALGRRCKVTITTSLLALLNLLLHRVSGSDDITVGIPMCDRRRLEFEELIGLFTNAVIVRTTMSPRMTFLDLLERVRAGFAEACSYQDLPYGHLVRVINADRPLYRVLLNYTPGSTASSTHPSHLGMEKLTVDADPRSFADISLHVHGGWPNELSCRFVYKADVFSLARIHQFASEFQSLLSAVLEAPQMPIQQHP